MKKKVVVGMSGGVDSSVAAYLLKEQGYDVIGVTMQIWQDDHESENSCCGLSAVADARRVADTLDIPYYVLNFRQEFKNKVIDYFVAEYVTGRTPNPCIACNRMIKWESLLDKAVQLGAEYIATGHYASIEKHPNGRFVLKKSVATAKDQTYALYGLTQYQLSRTLMPVGAYTKEQIRKIATEIGLNVANKPDSQEICFIPDNDYGRFISQSVGQPIEQGNFVDTNGAVLGRHKGVAYYTIGQRKGLGVWFGKRMFVKAIDIDKNQVVLAEDSELYQSGLIADEINYMLVDKIEKPVAVKAKIRYSHAPADCTIWMDQEEAVCKFASPQRAITPGQAVVFYDGDYVLGGGVIRNGL